MGPSLTQQPTKYVVSTFREKKMRPNIVWSNYKSNKEADLIRLNLIM
jgi:hypothetical protein